MSLRSLRVPVAYLSSGLPVVPLVVVLAAVAASPPHAGAQVLYGSIVGNVHDSSGAILPGATVTILHEETKLTREATADSAGGYTFTAVPTGTYVVTVSLTGFRTFTRSSVPVTLNTVTRVDAALPVGEIAETVTVIGESPLLQTDRAEVRAELREHELRDLPVPVGRNYQRLFKVLPGFTPPEDAHSIPSNPSRALVFNVNGSSRSSNNTRIDGVSTTNVWLPHVSAYVPALESLETVNVVTNSFDAEQGLAGGSVINVQVKSGTNKLSGSAFEYHTNEALRAKNYFDPPDAKKGEWRYHQFGGTVGGPIVRNKLFYFASYENTRDQRNASATISVPTEPLRRGDLAASSTLIYDPMTGNPDGSARTPFPGNIIPPNRIDPIAQKIIALMPLPNRRNPDGSIPETNNYFVQSPFTFNRWTLDTKVTLNATSKLNLFARYSQLDFWTYNETVYGQQLQGRPITLPGNPGTGAGNTYNFSAGATYTLSNTLVADAHFGYVRMYTGVEHSDIDERQKGMDFLGIPGTNGPRRFEGGMPLFDFDVYEDVGISERYMPYYRNDDQYQTVVNLNWLKGRHNVRFGTDIYYQALNHTQPELSGTYYTARGGFQFRSNPTLVRGGPSGNQFNSWAAFLLGLPNELGRLLEVEDPYTTRMRSYSIYARDQWQAASKLTVSYGVRWEYFPTPTRADRGLERYNPNTNMMEIGGVGSVPMDLGIKIEKGLFAPRLGVTYRATPRTVLRAGFGITNDPYSLARPLRTNHPILINLVVPAADSWSSAGRLADGIPAIAAPSLGNGIIPIPGNITAFTLPDEFNRGYIQSFNVAIQKELTGGLVGEAAYVGTRQIDQLGFRELNWSPIGGGQAGRQLARYGRTAQTRVVAPIGDSQYDALQTRLDRRFTNGFQLGVSYTLSKSTGIEGAPNSDGIAAVKIPEFYDLNRALSSFDRTHNFNISSIVELPFGRGRRWATDGVAAALAGGWQVNNVLSFYSGTPFNVTASGTSLNAPESDQRADQVVSDVKILGGIGRGNAYFDPLAFKPVTEARFGTAPWRVLRGPGVANWDLGVFRQFDLPRGMSVQLRIEAFNVLDKQQFMNPGGTAGTNVSNLRLNPDGSVRDLNGFAEIVESTNERQVRIGLRLGW
jgi:Carboxypeptidase regulatory-like domain/TonB dependent receptor-like, beta-barrel